MYKIHRNKMYYNKRVWYGGWNVKKREDQKKRRREKKKPSCCNQIERKLLRETHFHCVKCCIFPNEWEKVLVCSLFCTVLN